MDDRPTLQTRRLCLRPPAPGGAAEIERLAGDRRIADTTESIPHPFPPGAALEWIDGRAAAWAEDRSLALVVTRRADDRLVGVVSLDRRGDGTVAELGYWVAVEYWNRGYATEAAQAILDCGFDALRLRRVTARCFVRNPASARVMTKAGLRWRERLPGGTVKWGVPEDVDVYELDRIGASAPGADA
jgi:ribosomal-protein-alanine N-acetyltransferase